MFTGNMKRQPITKRLIGPIPPRDEHGRMKIAPIMEKRVKVNVIGEPERDEKGKPIMEEFDARPALQYHAYDGSQVALEEATRGLKKYRVDVGIEPTHLVYARNDGEALEVFKKEWGILRIDQDAIVSVTLEK